MGVLSVYVYRLENPYTKEILEIMVVSGYTTSKALASDREGGYLSRYIYIADTDPDNFRISDRSPVGRMLLRSQKGDIMHIDDKFMMITDISKGEDKDGATDKHQDERK